MVTLLHIFHPQTVALSFGPVSIYWYGIGYVVAMVVGIYIMARLGRRRGYSFDDVLDVAFWVILGGLLGARLWYVITVAPVYFFHDPLAILRVWEGGMAIHGGVIGGAIALLCAVPRARFFQWADIIAPALAIGQGIGRWGNYFNQELYGWPSNTIWSIPIDIAHRVVGFEVFSFFHPVFLYESVLDVVLGCVLFYSTFRLRSKDNEGVIFALYLVGYNVIRFYISFLRIEPLPMWLGLQVHQWVALGMIGVGLFLWIQIRNKSK